MARPRNLPPGAKWVTLESGERRVELSMAIGQDPATGKRRFTKQRFRTAGEAADFYTETRAALAAGIHVAKEVVTLEQAATEWLAGKRNIKASTRAGYEQQLKPVLAIYGAQPVQKLTKAQLDDLVVKLTAGTLPIAAYPNGRTRPRRPWSGRTVAYTLHVLEQVLDDLIAQGRLTRNVAALVERPRHRPAKAKTWTAEEAEKFLASVATDRLFIAWRLALYGLRRGEIAGLRWEHVDLDAKTVTVGEVTRLAINGLAVEDDAKSEAGHRVLSMPRALPAAFREAHRRQAAEKLALGPAYTDSGFVVVDEAGNALHPETLSDWFVSLGKAAGVPRIRLHDARHTAATLLHLAGSQTALIAAWLGHSSAAFTDRTYVHSQDGALAGLADTFDGIYQ